MKRLLLAALPALIAATPAGATGSLICNTAGAKPIEVQLVFGHTVVSSVFQARLDDRGRAIPVTVAQAWAEPNDIRVDLVDPNAERHELRLRVKRRGDRYEGSIWRHGKRRWIRCEEG